jgi:hypothetical protein
VYFGTEISKEVKDQIIKNIESQWNGEFKTDKYGSVNVNLSVATLTEKPNEHFNYNIFNVFDARGENSFRPRGVAGASADTVMLYTKTWNENTPAHEVAHILGLKDKYYYEVKDTITQNIDFVDAHQIVPYRNTLRYAIEEAGTGNASRSA